MYYLHSHCLYIPQIDLTFILAEKLPAWENMNCLLLFILRTSWCDALRRTIIVLSVLSRQGQPSPWISAQSEFCPTSPCGNCRILIDTLCWSQYHPPWTSFGAAASPVNVDLTVSAARQTCNMVDMAVPADLLSWCLKWSPVEWWDHNNLPECCTWSSNILRYIKLDHSYYNTLSYIILISLY